MDFKTLLKTEPERLDLNYEQLQSILSETNAKMIHDPARHFLYRKGQSAGELNIILEGWVMKYDLLSEGTRQILQFCLPGELLIASHIDQPTRAHFAKTITPVRRLVIDKTPFLELTNSSMNLGTTLMRILLKTQARLEHTVTDLGRRPAVERISRLMLYLFARLGERDLGSDDSMCFPLTQNQMADATGLTPVHVNRTLRHLRKCRIVDVNHGSLKVKDWDLLLEAAGMTEADFKSLS